MKVYIGIDAHSTNYTLSSYNSEADDCTNAVTLKPEYEGIVKYAEKIKECDLFDISSSNPNLHNLQPCLPVYPLAFHCQ